MSHADTLDTVLRLLGRARYALDDLTGRTSALPEPILASAEKLADEIAAFIGHAVTDVPEDPQLYALRDFLGDTTDDDTGHPGIDPVHELAAHIEAAVLGGPGCDVTMVHYFGPRDAPVAGLFDANGHPQNCPAHAKPVHVPTPRNGELSESATRTTTPGRRPGEGCDVCRCQACHELIERGPQRRGWQHLGTDPRDHGPVPMNHAPGARFHGVPYACDGCGARPHDGVMCLAPDGKHCWRPLPGGHS